MAASKLPAGCSPPSAPPISGGEGRRRSLGERALPKAQYYVYTKQDELCQDRTRQDMFSVVDVRGLLCAQSPSSYVVTDVISYRIVSYHTISYRALYQIIS